MSATVKTTTLIAAIVLTAARLGAADGVLIVEKHHQQYRHGGDEPDSDRKDQDARRARHRRPAAGDRLRQRRAGDPHDRPGAEDVREMTKADVDRIGSQMSGAMALMQEQMKNLPPEQRERMEALMRGRGLAGAAAVKTEYRRNGTDKVGKWTCDKYDGYKKDEKVSEICTVAPATLGLTLADFDITKQAAQFFQQLAPQTGEQQMFSIGGADQGFSGIPVRSVVTVGQRQITTEVTEVTRKTFPSDSYAVPAGFQKQELPLDAEDAKTRRVFWVGSVRL
jgi:hypothetical protein